MSSKVYLGRRLVNMAAGDPLPPVSKVVLNVDSETCYVSGDDTGTTIEQNCPWATQAMADSVLARLKGFVYRPFNGDGAILDPTVEMGDGITVGGIYTVLASLGRSFDPLLTATIGAPGSEELEDEYPYETKERRQTNRELAKAYSLISKTAEEIRLEVSGLDDKYTALSVTLDGVTVTDSTGTTKIKGSSIETDTLYVNAANIAGQLTADQIDATNLKVSAANITGTLTIGNLPADVAMTSDIPSDAEITVITNNAIRTASISANQITAGTFNGYNNVLNLSGLLRLIDPNGTTYGQIGSGYGNSDGTTTYGAALFNTAGSGGFFTSGSGARMFFGTNGIYCAGSGCFSTSEMKVGSDQRLKHSISYDLTKEEEMFKTLKPCSFAYKRDEAGKRRWGFIAQDVVGSAELAAMDVDTLDVVAKDDQGMYAIAYGEMVALNTHMIQKLMDRVSALEAKG